jgi:DNA-binding PucR family transcriptional regulator
MHGDILRSLLVSGCPASEVQERAALLGHDLTAPQCVVVLRPPEGGELVDLSLAVGASGWASGSAGLRAMLGAIDGCYVALLSAEDRALSRRSVEAWIEAFKDRLATLGFEVELRFGVSRVTGSPQELASAFNSARQALAVSKLDRGSPTTHFEDVELVATLVSSADPALLRRFVSRSVGEIEEYDRERDSSLAETLEVYLDHSRVARHAAKALYLHPHSLRYRLRRIDEIQGVDLDDPNERLMTHLALKLRSFV